MEICQCHGIFYYLVLQSVDNQFDFFQFFAVDLFAVDYFAVDFISQPILISIGEDLFIRSRSVHSMEYAESALPTSTQLYRHCAEYIIISINTFSELG